MATHRSFLSRCLAWFSRRVPLEEQLAQLSRIGISLNRDITIDDLLFSAPRDDYESPPYDLLLVMLGSEVEREPWGRAFCDRVWNFDTECIEDNGDYVTIVKRLFLLAGMSERLTAVSDHVDIEHRTARLHYTCDGIERQLSPRIDDDWVDSTIVDAVMDDIEQPPCHFYAKDNGQASVWVYLDDRAARQLNQLTRGAFVKR